MNNFPLCNFKLHGLLYIICETEVCALQEKRSVMSCRNETQHTDRGLNAVIFYLTPTKGVAEIFFFKKIIYLVTPRSVT